MTVLLHWLVHGSRFITCSNTRFRLQRIAEIPEQQPHAMHLRWILHSFHLLEFCNFPKQRPSNNWTRYSIPTLPSGIIYVYIKFLNDSANTTWKINVVTPIPCSAGRSCINKTTQDIQKYVEFSMGDCRSMNTQNMSLSPCCGAFSSQPDDTSIKLSESLATFTDCKCLLVLVLLNRILCTPPWHLV